MPKGIYIHRKLTISEKKHLSEINKGRKIIWGDKISKAKIGKKRPHLSEEWKTKISISNMGRIMSEATKKKLGDALRGKTNWHKGKKRTLITKEKISLGNREEKSYKWKGNGVGYFALHHWVNKYKGKPQECQHCGKNKKKFKLHWANIDHKYRRVLEDYIPLCVECHKKYDLENNINKHFSREMKNGTTNNR